METNNIETNLIIPEHEVVQESKGNFIEANTSKVTLEHLKNDCIIPVFSKDNETTISHYEFINGVQSALVETYPDHKVLMPDVRVSHVIKGRVPSAIGKPVKELLDHEKTMYWERMAFMIEMPEFTRVINGNKLSLTVGGVRAYNNENLYSKKSLEKFKVFIGFKNWVCCNLCVSSDGFSSEIRVGSINELIEKVMEVFVRYQIERHIELMEFISRFNLTEIQFAHLMGKLKMSSYGNVNKLDCFDINDSQVNNVIKGFYGDSNFKRMENGSIGLWSLYNLFTGANKSSYVHNNLDRNVNSFEFCYNLANSLDSNVGNWFLN